jgi:aspartyl-tRNA(Asn)/glutamyl-tRNA(Gln) amidotransferase subunit C
MALDKNAVAQIVSLARLRVAEAELAALAADLSQILTWVEQLNEVDTAGVEPMSTAVTTLLPMREDRVTDGGCREAILANAPGRAIRGIDPGFFVVPKVIE